MKKIELNIAKDFSITPGPRYKWEGKNCGAEFRQDKLLPKVAEALRLNKKLEVNLDGTAGYGTSFLEEAFGGLVRVEGINKSDLLKILQIISEEEVFWIDRIIEYIKKA